jgi:hypothetical protein
MTAVWIKKSKAAGPAGLTSRLQLGSQHNIAIVFGAFSMGSIPNSAGSLEAMGRGLLAAQNLDVSRFENGHGCTPFNLAMKLARIQGYAFLGIMGGGGGHAMGVRIHAGGHDFFDPNEGLVRCQGQVAFRTYVANRLADWYSDLLDGEWDIFEVA